MGRFRCREGRRHEAVGQCRVAVRAICNAVAVEQCRLVAVSRSRAVRGNSGGPEGPDAILHGTFAVADEETFAGVLRNGVGRHRAYGYGMLLLRRRTRPFGAVDAEGAPRTRDRAHSTRRPIGLSGLSRGALTARDGTLSFERGPNVSENDPLDPGHYAIPFQGVSMILLGPGSTCQSRRAPASRAARHGAGRSRRGWRALLHCSAVIPDRSGLARRQARAWADTDVRLHVARACTPGAWARCCLIKTLRSCVASKGPG